MPDRDSYPNCFGPYLRYAISTRFEYFEFFDEKENFKLFLLVEFKQPGRQKQEAFVDLLNNALRGPHSDTSSRSVELGPADDDISFGTLRAPTAAVTPLEPGGPIFSLWEQYVSKVELSLPLKLSVAPPVDNKRTVNQRWRDGGSKPLLIGTMDDGCPFAAAQFLRIAANSQVSTRVRGIWDQNRHRKRVDVNTRSFGEKLTDFAFGLEYLRNPLSANQIGLDEWLSMHATPAGSIDEDGCYADAKFTRLASQQSHGAHVMDLLAGSTPLSSRISPGGDRRYPPSWAPGNPTTDPACDADVVFVQFSNDCIRDATGVWLKAYVLEGIRYIMSFAEPNVTENVIINLSYGPTTGPHDGTAELETALTQLVTYYNGSPGRPKLDIFLAAGNSYLTEEHVVFTADNQPAEVEWTWCLPPDNTALCFAEIWTDNNNADDIFVTLTPPSGHVNLTSAPGVVGTTLPTPGGTAPRLIGPIVWGNDRMWLLEVGPTIAAPGVAANEHGDWTIRVTGIGAGKQIDGYVARTDPNMGVTTGSKRSLFIDPVWERDRSAAANCTFVSGEFDKTGSLVSRFGTLNGIATADQSAVHVAGGYVLLDECKSPYSSAGPTRDYPVTPRAGPDYVLPCDESYALEGILAGGTRSGSVFRMIGTSNAAPELARLFTKYIGATYPPPSNVPTTLPDTEKRGSGDLGAP
ncbi:MAG: hypothetical protein WA702_00655 [Bradyrhizobium sp.]|jgi:hypothetical protein|uniref:hypothetical protein n=1 Tax=Bradyrhizobium sp. TaxID=376 RepID=UPI003C7A94E5